MRRCRPQNLSPSPHVTLFVYAFLWTRQNALAYNQPLSFNTSSVRNMDYMFYVRLRACPCAHTPIGFQAHCLRRRLPHALPPGPHVALIVCPPLDSAERASVQPAAESRHVQRHEHAVHVCGALHTVPILVGSSLHAACAAAARKTSLPARMSPSSSMPSFGLGRAR